MAQFLNFELEKHIFPGGSGEFCLAKYTAVYDFIFAHSAVYIARYTSLHGLKFFEDNMRSR